MRKWLRDPVTEIPEIPGIPPAGGQPSVSDPAQLISGICGISGTGVGLEDDLQPEGGAPVPADAATTLARRSELKDRPASAALRRPSPGDWSAKDWLELYEEKAAIGEYDHGLPRREAEKRAVDVCIGEWLSRHPAFSDADDGCPICGDVDRPNDPLLLIGLAGAGQVWLHRDCVPAWRSARIAAAVAALSSMNIQRSR